MGRDGEEDRAGGGGERKQKLKQDKRVNKEKGRRKDE